MRNRLIGRNYIKKTKVTNVVSVDIFEKMPKEIELTLIKCQKTLWELIELSKNVGVLGQYIKNRICIFDEQISVKDESYNIGLMP